MIKKVRVEATILQLSARSSILVSSSQEKYSLFCITYLLPDVTFHHTSLVFLYQITKLKFIRGGEVGLELGEVFFHRGEICATDRTDTF